MSKKSILGAITTTLTALGINAVPASGLFILGWAAETAILLYLIENLVAIPLAALRVRLLAPAWEDAPGRKPRNRRTMLNGYLVVALGFSIGSGVFILFFVFGISSTPIDLGMIRYSLASILAFQLFGFLSDLVWLRPLPLARAGKLLETSLGRVFLLYLAVFLGMFLALFNGYWFFGTFMVLKTIVDVGTPIQFFLDRRKNVPLVEGQAESSGLWG